MTQNTIILGPDNVPVTVVEYVDYEFPYCEQVYPIIKQIQDNLGDNICFVFRNFPLLQVHPHAHRAAEVASAQNKFWKMHDFLYEHQQAIGDKHFGKICTDIRRSDEIQREYKKSCLCIQNSRGFSKRHTKRCKWYIFFLYQWNSK